MCLSSSQRWRFGPFLGLFGKGSALALDVRALPSRVEGIAAEQRLMFHQGTALLWVAPGSKAGVFPLITSHGSGCGFTSDFSWDGASHAFVHHGFRPCQRIPLARLGCL